ncbi:MAG TPA: cyclic nucleotide-binding domain-containing protein, partial [Aggregicoccus sp.]|nr:cyclic nucleotide-binding domain-containing protein [Aggregicoccus sp.]
MPADATLLAEVPLFATLDDAERALLAAQLDEVQVAAGARVFNRGDPGGAIYIVAEGEVQISVEDTTGQRIVFETAGRGDFFGELSLLDGDPRSADATAVQATRALRVDRQDLALLFRRHPDSAMDVLTVMGRRLREADRHLRNRPSYTPNQAVEEQLTPVQRVADFLAALSGTFKFLLLHAAWFTLWIGLNLGAVRAVQPFDPYPFGLLTMVVSLEAIFLSCFVLISQSRSAARERIRS